ncbi:F-actin-monooxygenase MICAL3 isoform X8 [Parasteatoda tepidariorum]|uniref:F-actin-monooxygenase MICAL3 isoform X8 n=2 Tax=Parasteatoda tepidariorum TaxID=114398 RepID=UPI0039BC2FAD
MTTKQPNTLVDVSEGTGVSNNSPQSPTGRTLLEPITLDFDPMSFEFKEDSPLTSPSDSNRDIGETLSPFQNTEVVEFFDPFCPVKEESPTDYYPNVMLGQTPLGEPLTEQQQYSNGFSSYTVQDDLLNQPNLPENEDDRLQDSVYSHHSRGGINDRIDDDDALIDVMDDSVNNKHTEDQVSDRLMGDQISDKLMEDQMSDRLMEDPMSDRLMEDQMSDKLMEDPMSDRLMEDDSFNDDLIEDRLDESNLEDSSVNDKLDLDEKPVEILADLGTNSELSAAASSKSEITDENDLTTELEQTQSEDTCVSPISEKIFDDNKHDLSSQHEQLQISEDDLSKRGRTSSNSSSQSIKSDRSEKRSSYKSSITNNYKEEVKTTSNSISSKVEKENQKKEITTKKATVKTETNGYSSHNGIDTVSLKNSKNAELTKEEKPFDGLASVTDLKSSFTKSTEELQQNNQPEEVKSSVDRVKVQRTFSQTPQDELCLCKICGKHVYQMEKMKAERNIFHKNCFRCKECNKLLNVDSYSSNEGDIYCKPHFRQLFQPKARFDGEDGAPRKQRRNEMIIRENVPAELPPDVIRSDSKPDHGLENIPVNLSSIKSKFETYREEHHLPSTTDACTLQRSASVMARLAKYQSAVSGGENENGELSESDNDEECSEDPTVIKPSKHKEKVVFSGMSSLKSQWESGSVTATKEERIEEKKEELNKLRQRICLGRSESMKAVYEKACQDTAKPVVSRTEAVDIGRDVKATRIKEKFEKGELVDEVEDEKLEKFRKEKEEDLSVFTEPGMANDAKKLFQQMDATVKTTPITPSKSPTKSPIHDRQINFHSPVKEGDVVKCSEPTEKEDIPVDTTDVTQRFKFFENYSDAPKERKRFQITPPREPARESSPEPEVPHDPNVVRAVDTIDDIPSTDTARRMLDKFKQLEKETPSLPSGPKPLKRITPPREYTKVDESHDSSPEPERDPSIIRSSYKADEDIVVEADKAKSLRAKFENWDTELRDNRRNEDDEGEDFLPQIDTTKNLRAKFEAIKEDTVKTPEKPKPKVNRFIQEQAAVNTDVCSLCGKKVYPMEKMETSGMRIHKNCFRCAHCSCMLRLENYTKSGRNLYCTPHFKQLFISRGNYDEGFGREQHKEKWNRSCNNTPVPRDLQENDDLELSNGDVQCLEQTV